MANKNIKPYYRLRDDKNKPMKKIYFYQKEYYNFTNRVPTVHTLRNKAWGFPHFRMGEPILFSLSSIIIKYNYVSIVNIDVNTSEQDNMIETYWKIYHKFMLSIKVRPCCTILPTTNVNLKWIDYNK